jgi:anti-sigma regulatory factor (Ser/Thr protein kinase)
VSGLKRELQITNDARNLSLVRQAVGEVLAQSTFSVQDRNKIILAVDEALANVVEHAYPDSMGIVEVAFDLDPARLVVTIRDNGVKFNPEARPTPDVQELIKRGAKGGYGLLLMRKIMDEVRYVLDTTWSNELVMTKKLPPPASA